MRLNWGSFRAGIRKPGTQNPGPGQVLKTCFVPSRTQKNDVTMWLNRHICTNTFVPSSRKIFGSTKKTFSKPGSVTSNLECDEMWRKCDVTSFRHRPSLKPRSSVWENSGLERPWTELNEPGTQPKVRAGWPKSLRLGASGKRGRFSAGVSARHSQSARVHSDCFGEPLFFNQKTEYPGALIFDIWCAIWYLIRAQIFDPRLVSIRRLMISRFTDDSVSQFCHSRCSTLLKYNSYFPVVEQFCIQLPFTT